MRYVLLLCIRIALFPFYLLWLCLPSCLRNFVGAPGEIIEKSESFTSSGMREEKRETSKSKNSPSSLKQTFGDPFFWGVVMCLYKFSFYHGMKISSFLLESPNLDILLNACPIPTPKRMCFFTSELGGMTTTASIFILE